MKRKFNTGDVVVIEWKDIKPHTDYMQEFDNFIGVVESKAFEGYWVTCKSFNHSGIVTFIWHPSSLHYIGKL